VVASTVKAASWFAAGRAAATGAISPEVAALTDGVLKAMLMSKLKAAIAVVLVLGLMATGATVLTRRTAAGQDDKKPPAEIPVGPEARQEKEKQGFTAWGKAVGGLQAGLGFRPGEHRVYHHGETATVVLRVRNVGKEAVEFKYIWAFFLENPPTVTDADGIVVQLPRGTDEGRQLPRNTSVPPGKEVELYEWKLDLQPKGGSNKELFTIHGTGKFGVQCERIVGPTSGNPNHPNPTLDKLATGKLELEVKDAEKSPEGREREGFTAWGKEVGGVQAGLGFRPGQKRAYHTGETVWLLVRARNVGKKDVKFSYFNEFFYENPPAVTDGEGKPVPLEGAGLEGLARLMEGNLAPGKEVKLCEVSLELRPASQKGKERPVWKLFGTGKFQLQYERVGGNIGAGEIKLDPTLSKLATGRLELEVKDAEKSPAEREREGFTAWGKEVGGLQAGLDIRPDARRAYHYGEAVTLVVRVHNVGKETVKFKYLKEFFDENPPVVTDADGKTVPQLNIEAGGLIHVPREVSLAPGKEIELASKYGGVSGVRYELRPASEKGKSSTGRKLTPLFGTGKVSVRYNRVFGNSSAGTITPDPILSKLATGKLELEIRSGPPPAAGEFPVGWGGGGQDYEVSVDRTVGHGGRASGSIRSIATTPLWYGALTQAFQADKFRGRRLRMTAYVKSKEVENSAGLWMRIEGFDGKGNYSLSSDYMGDRPIKGTNDWKQYEVVLDVPDEGTAQVYFGVLLAGKGQVWADDFKFEAVGKAVKTTGRVGETRRAAAGSVKGLPTEPKNLDFEQ
jgi:hypothetical protein